MTPPTPYIRLEKVEVAYNDYVAGLRGVSLSVERGEFVFLCGQTGSGKSTILKVLSCQVKPTGGKAIFDGFDLGTATIDDVPLLRRKIGIVPQDFGLLPNKKVWENVGYAMRAVGRSRQDVRLEVPEILEKVNILHRADAYPGELSGGEQQRVAIARALINDPPLLLADEPTGNLDPGHSEELIDLLASLNARGTTVIVATHDMAVVARESRRIVKIAFGRLDTEDEDVDEEFQPETKPSELEEGQVEPEAAGDGPEESNLEDA